MKLTQGLKGLLSCKPNLKQGPFQTALSDSHLSFQLSPESCDLWSRDRSAACGMEQILHGSSLSLQHEGEPGRAGWDSMTYRRGRKKKKRLLWRHQCLLLTSAQDFPAAHPVPGESLLWGVIEPRKSLVSCHWLDSRHGSCVVTQTKHLSTLLDLKTNTWT